MAAAFDPELASVPLEDIDPFYANQAVSRPVPPTLSDPINEILLLIIMLSLCFFSYVSYLTILRDKSALYSNVCVRWRRLYKSSN